MSKTAKLKPKNPNRRLDKMAKQAAEAKKERGEGPISLSFTDNEGKGAYKRVPLNVAKINIANNHTEGDIAELNVAELPQETILALATLGASNRIKTYVANHGAKDGSDGVALAKEIWQQLVEGKVYSRSDKGDSKPGKKFDGSIYAKAWQMAYAVMNKKGMKKKDGSPVQAMTDEQTLDLQTQLEAMPSKERTEKLRAYKASSKFYELALAQLKAKQIDVKDAEVSDDMPF